MSERFYNGIVMVLGFEFLNVPVGCCRSTMPYNDFRTNALAIIAQVILVFSCE